MRACPRCYASYEGDMEFCGIDGTRLIETQQDLLIGCEVDRYEIIELLGRGAMGAVYRARHTSLRRDFALKVLSGAFAANAAGLARFHREADALSKIRHSNIVSVVDFVSTPQGLNVLIMDYYPGRTLHEVIQREAPLAPERAAKIARQIASGLAAAHALELVHRDVKPSNMLLVHEGREEVVKLLDFGVVTLEKQDDITERLTGEGRVVGTPTYMAPEQAREGPITHAADLYALGVVLYEMLAGHPPFQAKTVAEILVQHAIDSPPLLPAAKGVDAIAFRLLAKNPSDRYASGEAVMEAIDQALAGVPIEMPVIVPVASAQKKKRPRWPFAVGAAAIAVLLAIGLSQGKAEPPIVETKLDEQLAQPAVQTPPLVELGADDDGSSTEPTKRARVRRTKGGVRETAQPEPKDEGPLTQRELTKRLDGIMQTLRGASREIPPNLAKECDDDYLALRIAVNDSKDQAALRATAKRIRLLERRVATLRKGERVGDSR